MTRFACIPCCLFVAAVYAMPQQMEWKDSSPHATKSVTVEEGVQLEVLDWGGTGPALVLLAGLGNTAHYYDDFAPALTPRFRVIGVTRRGHRGSTAAPGGYGFVRLADDIVQVMDSLGIKSAVVVGHSFAGEEMHVLGARHAARIRGLVYVDAAFDRGDNADSEAFDAVARKLPAAPGPQRADLKSFDSLRAHLAQYGAVGPEAYLRTRYRTNGDGSIGGFWSPDLAIRQAIAKEMRAAYNPYRPEPIRVPAIALYALPKSASDLMRRGSSDRQPFPDLVTRSGADRTIRETAGKLYALTRERVRKHASWFKSFAPAGQERVVRLSGTHDLIVSNPRKVLKHIRAFVSSLPGNP